MTLREDPTPEVPDTPGHALIHSEGRPVLIKLPAWLETYRSIRSEQKACLRRILRLTQGPEKMDEARTSVTMKSLDEFRSRAILNQLPPLRRMAVSVQLSYATRSARVVPQSNKASHGSKEVAQAAQIPTPFLPPISESLEDNLNRAINQSASHRQPKTSTPNLSEEVVHKPPQPTYVTRTTYVVHKNRHRKTFLTDPDADADHGKILEPIRTVDNIKQISQGPSLLELIRRQKLKKVHPEPEPPDNFAGYF